MENELSPETTWQIDFNLQWVPAALGLDVPPAATAAIFGVSETALLAYADTVDAEVEEMAQQFLARPEMQKALATWPLDPGDAVLFLGDSITTYAYSYARLLAAMIGLQRPRAQITFANVAQSGYTSTHGLENTYTQFLTHDPDWVFLKYGVNDCKQFGRTGAKTLVSRAEYEANVRAMVQAFRQYTTAGVVLLTPTPVVEDVVNENPDFKEMRMTWDNDNLRAFAEVVRHIGTHEGLPVVDLMALFGPDPDPDLYLDGLHPAPAGHRLILQAVLDSLPAERGEGASAELAAD